MTSLSKKALRWLAHVGEFDTGAKIDISPRNILATLERDRLITVRSAPNPVHTARAYLTTEGREALARGEG